MKTKAIRRAVKARMQSAAERFKRQYHAEVRKLKRWAEENNIEVYDYQTAPLGYVCVLSMVEYDVGMCRENMEQDHECYFMTEENYEQDYAAY